MPESKELAVEPLSAEQFKAALPEKLKKSVNRELMANINEALTDPGYAQELRDNFLTYASVLRDGRYKLTDYLNAVKYVSHKLMGSTNVDAYIKTFPDRYQELMDRGASQKDISAYVAIYNKGKLVNAIFEQTLIPSYILNQDVYQKALKVQAELMVSAKSEKVRTDAANSILNHLKQPEKSKVEMDINVNDTGGALAELRAATQNLAQMQRQAIESGKTSAEEVAHSKIIDVKAERIDE